MKAPRAKAATKEIPSPHILQTNDADQSTAPDRKGRFTSQSLSNQPTFYTDCLMELGKMGKLTKKKNLLYFRTLTGIFKRLISTNVCLASIKSGSRTFSFL